MSTSIGRDKFTLVRKFLVHMLGQYDIGKDQTHVGMLSYSSKAILLNQINDTRYFDTKKLQDLAMNFKYWEGGTRTDYALEMAYDKFFRKEIDRPNDRYKNVLLVLTDGNTNSKSKPYPEVLKPLKERDVTVFAVGIGKDISESELEEIADHKKKNVFHVDNFEDLAKYLDELLDVACSA